jgi:hypothetical protein
MRFDRLDFVFTPRDFRDTVFVESASFNAMIFDLKSLAR